ncbi:MAG: ATP synthase A1 subunit C [Methanomassiliicoccales archaeon]|nr:ATP synthase A1 subunit C [Methanomassiliicoccales archaeon]
MWPYRVKRGNYAYACARVRAKKSLLLTKDAYPKLLMMDLNEIGRFMGETQYKTEISELALRYEGVDLIELSTSKNLARVYTGILGFTKGELRDMIAAYLARWDVWNVKTVVRGKYYGASVDEIREDLVPAGRLREEDLNSLLALGSIPEVLDALGKFDLSVPEEVRSSFEKEGLLSGLEDYLDKLYYSKLLSTIDVKRRPEQRFMAFMKKEIDATNLLTLLKLKMEGLSPDKIVGYRIDGGASLHEKEFARLASLESLDAVVSELAKYPFYEDIKEFLEVMKQTKSLTEVSLAMKRHVLKEAQTFSRVYPLSVLPIIDYMIRKRTEVDNLRIIARGKQGGLDSETIKKLLVI